MVNKQWKKEQASRCTADFCLHQLVNQLYNNQKMAKLVLFSTACISLRATNLCRADVPGSEDCCDGGRAAVRDLRGAVAPLDGAQLREQRPQRRHDGTRVTQLAHFSLEYHLHFIMESLHFT